MIPAAVAASSAASSASQKPLRSGQSKEGELNKWLSPRMLTLQKSISTPSILAVKDGSTVALPQLSGAGKKDGASTGPTSYFICFFLCFFHYFFFFFFFFFLVFWGVYWVSLLFFASVVGVSLLFFFYWVFLCLTRVFLRGLPSFFLFFTGG